MPTKNWFLAHRRNASLHHASLFINGLKNKGYLPVVDFHFNNQIIIGKPGKGCYYFYDNDQIRKKYIDIQRSINENKNFHVEFKDRDDKIFEELFQVCRIIEQTDIANAHKTELLQLLKLFREKITTGPLISVQLWGIEACWDNDGPLAKELKQKVSSEDFPVIRGDLSISTGKSVAFSERTSFWSTMAEIQKKHTLIGDAHNVINETDDVIDENTTNLTSEIKDKIIDHISNFEWINSEYVSKKLCFEDWLNLFMQASGVNAEIELDKLHDSQKKAIESKQKLIESLNLSAEARHTLDALDAFISQRDWAKGKFCYALGVYNKLLDEIGRRLETCDGEMQNREDLLHYRIDELIDALDNGSLVDVKERKKAFALVSIEGNLRIIEGDEVDILIHEEGLNQVFEKVEEVGSFKGMVANKGIVNGKVRVIDDPRRINEFQDGEIIVTYMTTMEFTPIFKKAKAVITDEGGLSSHAAIISREFGLPCIVGTKIGTRVLKTGDEVEVDANRGTIKKISKDF